MTMLMGQIYFILWMKMGHFVVFFALFLIGRKGEAPGFISFKNSLIMDQQRGAGWAAGAAAALCPLQAGDNLSRRFEVRSLEVSDEEN